jgi:hypothetical protein
MPTSDARDTPTASSTDEVVHSGLEGDVPRTIREACATRVQDDHAGMPREVLEEGARMRRDPDGHEVRHLR